MILLEWWQWALAGLCSFLVGVAKTGVPGLGILVVPMMAIAAGGEARKSAGWLLPLLCTADVFAVWYWRRHAAAGRLFSLAPWVLIGLAGGAVALGWPENILRFTVGGIVLFMLGAFLYRRHRAKANPAAVTPHPLLYGVTAGFATTVANAAGPVMNLYLLSKRLPKEEFIATGAWFFFFINLTKLPVYVWRGMITQDSLAVDAVLVPAVVLGAAAGRRLVHHIPESVFEAIVVILTAASTLMLFR